jgi:ribonucleoside-triphosphate reductase (formate)
VSTLLGKIKQYNADGSAYYTQLLGHKIMFNTELVPAENVGVKFAKWDKAKGLSISRDCYNSYLYIVESDSCTIADKFRMHGKQVLDNLDGGSAVHLNLKECPNKGTWLKIIALAIKAGCNYWTYNVRETCCNDCGFISKEDRQTCPKCGSKNVTWATRIIGYLKKVISFSAERQTEEKKRFKH